MTSAIKCYIPLLCKQCLPQFLNENNQKEKGKRKGKKCPKNTFCSGQGWVLSEVKDIFKRLLHFRPAHYSECVTKKNIERNIKKAKIIDGKQRRKKKKKNEKKMINVLKVCCCLFIYFCFCRRK